MDHRPAGSPRFALFQLAALHCYLRARRSPAANWLRLGVFFVASSFAVKHSALFGAVPLAVLYVHLLWKRGRLVRDAIIMAGIFSVFGLCWQARTFALTGNPVYPIKWHWAVEALRPDSMRAPDAMSIPYYQIPWRIHFDGTLEGLPATAFESPLSLIRWVFSWWFACPFGFWFEEGQRIRSSRCAWCLAPCTSSTGAPYGRCFAMPFL